MPVCSLSTQPLPCDGGSHKALARGLETQLRMSSDLLPVTHVERQGLSPGVCLCPPGRGPLGQAECHLSRITTPAGASVSSPYHPALLTWDWGSPDPAAHAPHGVTLMPFQLSRVGPPLPPCPSSKNPAQDADFIHFNLFFPVKTGIQGFLSCREFESLNKMSFICWKLSPDKEQHQAYSCSRAVRAGLGGSLQKQPCPAQEPPWHFSLCPPKPA